VLSARHTWADACYGWSDASHGWSDEGFRRSDVGHGWANGWLWMGQQVVMDGPMGDLMPVMDGPMLGSDGIYWMGLDAYSNDL
jgi:hypothetical protein